ncbi:MAG: hypothetical protein ACYCZD_01870 [Rhodanobacter sp.]
MRGFWTESQWRIDGADLVLPNGQRLALSNIRQWRANLIDGNLDLCGRWPGWRVRQHYLIAPGGSLRRGRIAERTLRHIVQGHDTERIEHSRRQLGLF